jgi:formiminotetrahydrofolate cyclodeaminase
MTMMASTTTKAQIIGHFVAALAAKNPTPGGGAAAAVGASIGAAAATMAAVYTQRKKDKESGAAEKAEKLIASMDLEKLLAAADDDAAAYADLQRSWKDDSISPEKKAAIEARALAVPVSLVETCHEYVVGIKAFLPDCNPNITSDAKVGIHQLAGAARAAYQTALVNSPPPEEKERLRALLNEIRAIEDELLA